VRAQQRTEREEVWRDAEADALRLDSDRRHREEVETKRRVDQGGLEDKEREDFDHALADFNEAIRLDPKDAVAYTNRGGVYYEQKDYNRAFADFNETIRLDPKYALAYMRRGNVYFVQKDYDRALADYDEAIRLDPKYALAYQNRGNAKRAKGDSKGGDGDLAEAARLASSVNK
jgi:tetratricopeptide (TPR) repeat protein